MISEVMLPLHLGRTPIPSLRSGSADTAGQKSGTPIIQACRFRPEWPTMRIQLLAGAVMLDGTYACTDRRARLATL